MTLSPPPSVIFQANVSRTASTLGMTEAGACMCSADAQYGALSITDIDRACTKGDGSSTFLGMATHLAGRRDIIIAAKVHLRGAARWREHAAGGAVCDVVAHLQ